MPHKRYNKNKTKKNKIVKKTKNNRRTRNKNSIRPKKMRGGQDEKPQEGSLRLYRDENPQF